MDGRRPRPPPAAGVRAGLARRLDHAAWAYGRPLAKRARHALFVGVRALGLQEGDEILAGRIEHPLVLGMTGVASGAPRCPATQRGLERGPLALPEGALLQLDSAIDVDGLGVRAWQKPIVRAVQEYGVYVRDGGGSLSIYADNSHARGYDAWAKLGLDGASAALKGIPWERFRVIAAASC